MNSHNFLEAFLRSNPWSSFENLVEYFLLLDYLFMVMVDTMQLAITSSQATLIHPIGGAIAVATAGKVFFKGAIIAAAGAIAIGAFHKALHDFWKQHLGPNTQMPKAITNCMNGFSSFLSNLLILEF